MDAHSQARSCTHYNKTETRVIVMEDPAAIIRKKQIQGVQDARHNTILNLRKTMKPRRLGAPLTMLDKKLQQLDMEDSRLRKKGKGRTRRLRKRTHK
jgi:hypothetical protein